MSKRVAQFLKYADMKDTIVDTYIHHGRKGVCEIVDIPYNSLRGLLNFCGCYSDEVKIKKKEYETMIARLPKHYNPFEVLNNESAYLLGFIYSDGCLLGRVNEKYNRILSESVDISSDDYDILCQIVGLFRLPDTRISSYLKQGTKNVTYSFRTDDYNTVESLKRLGLRNRKSTEGCVMPKLPKELYSHFVRGLLDGDGYVRIIRPRSSKGRVRLEVSICGHSSYLKDIVKNTQFNWKYRERKILSYIGLYKDLEVREFYKWVYNDATIKMLRKYNAFYYCYERGEVYEQYREHSHN